MSAETIFALLGSLVLGALIVSAVAHNRHQKELANKQLLQSIKLQLSEIADHASLAQQLQLPVEATLIFKRYQLALIERLQALPNAPNNAKSMGVKLKQEINSFSSLEDIHTATNISEEGGLTLETDKEIQTYQQQIKGMVKTLDQLRTSSAITQANHQIFSQQLKWKFVQIESDAYVHKALRLLELGDRTSAVDALRHAKKKLFEFQSSDIQREVLLQKINHLIRETLDNSATKNTEKPNNSDTEDPTDGLSFEPKKKF